MPKYVTEQRVGHSANEMLALVADVERYPGFVPLCEKLVIRARRAEGAREIMVADMTIAYAVIRETFTTQVTVDRTARTVAASYLDGPFRHLDSEWRFRPAGEHACMVRFAIDYEFRSRVLAAVMGGVFDTAIRKFHGAFRARADAVYGAPTIRHEGVDSAASARGSPR